MKLFDIIAILIYNNSKLKQTIKMTTLRLKKRKLENDDNDNNNNNNNNDNNNDDDNDNALLLDDVPLTEVEVGDVEWDVYQMMAQIGVSADDVHTYFLQRDLQIANTGRFNPDLIEGLNPELVRDLNDVEIVVLRRRRLMPYP